MLSEDAFVFSEEEVFSYSVVDLRGIRPAVRLVAVVPSNLFVVPRGLAGEDKEAGKFNVLIYIKCIKSNHNLLDSALAFGWAEIGLWFGVVNRAVFSFIVEESIVFCLLKLLLLKR